MRLIHPSLLIIFMLLFLGACKDSNTKASKNSLKENSEKLAKERTGQAFVKDDEGKPTVLNIAIGSANHTTLVAAVQAAELENALVNAGPLMVFAPTNEAFDALPDLSLIHI